MGAAREGVGRWRQSGPQGDCVRRGGGGCHTVVEGSQEVSGRWLACPCGNCKLEADKDGLGWCGRTFSLYHDEPTLHAQVGPHLQSEGSQARRLSVASARCDTASLCTRCSVY